MKRFRLFLNSVKYSANLVYQSSKLGLILYFILRMMLATLPLISINLLNNILNSLTSQYINVKMTFFIVVVYISILVISQIFLSIANIVENSIFLKAFHAYDVEICQVLSKIPMSVIDTSEGKDLIDDVRYTKITAVYLTYRLISVISLFYSFCIALVTLISYNFWFSLLFIILTIPGIIIDIVFNRKSDELRRRVAPNVRKFSYYRWMLTDAWTAKDVRMYDLTDSIKERYDTEKDIYRSKNKALDKKNLRVSLIAEIIKRSGEILFTIFVIFQAINGKISIGNIALYTGYALVIISSFQEMTTIFVLSYTVTVEKMKRLFKFKNLEYKYENKNSRKLDSFQILEFKNVYFKYPMSDKYILKGTSFTINKGDKLSIIGVNGCGKSTIVKLILGLYIVQDGEILINGYPIGDYDIKDVRKLFSSFFQTFVQYPLTLRENVVLSDLSRENNESEILDALKQSGIYENHDKFNIELDSYMSRQFHDKGIELSKGQWQKVALSRAYFKNSPVIIFDEPSSALDAEAEDRIFKNFESISNNKTGIMISHRISSARLSNKIIVLNDGKIVENGTHEELLTLNGFYTNLYNMQMKKYTLGEV